MSGGTSRQFLKSHVAQMVLNTHSNRSELTQLRVSMSDDITPYNESSHAFLREENTEPIFSNVFVNASPKEEEHESGSSKASGQYPAPNYDSHSNLHPSEQELTKQHSF